MPAQSTNYFTWSDPTLSSAVSQPVTSGWTGASAAAYPWLSGYPGVPKYIDSQPGYTQNTSTPVTLSLADAHGGSNTCSATVSLQVSSIPAYAVLSCLSSPRKAMYGQASAS